MSSYSPTPNGADAPPGLGTLQVELPHWGAQVNVLDHQHQPVPAASASKPSDAAPGTGTAEFVLPPGIYHVEIELGGQTERELVPVRPDYTTRVARDRKSASDKVRLESSAPLAGAANTRERHAIAAEAWSQKVTWTAPTGGDSRLFLFVRTLESGPPRTFADGLKLLDAGGRLVTDFTEGVRRNTRQGWTAFNGELPAGSYILRRGGRHVSLRFQPVQLVAGWQTQVFLMAERYPRLHLAAMNMASPSEGFRADDPSAIAAQVLIESLSARANRDLLSSEPTVSLLAGDRINPWLGILAAHALRAAGPRSNRSEHDETAETASRLLDHLLSVLAPLRDHPDIGALLLSDDEPAPQAFWSPPLLRRSLERIRDHATRHYETIPEGSLTDRVIDHLVINSPWTAWHTLDQLPSSVPETASTIGSGRSLLKVHIPTQRREAAIEQYAAALARGSSPAAPVIYLGDATQDSDWQVASVLPAIFAQATAAPTGATDDPAVQVAQTMIRPGSAEAVPETITVQLAGSLDRLIEGTDRRQLSTSLGSPLVHTERSLGLLHEQPAGDDPGAAPGPGPTVTPTPAQAAVLEVAVEQSLRPITQELTAKPTAPPPDVVASDAALPQQRRERPASPVFIEESLPRLLDDAAYMLSAAAQPPPGAEQEAAKILAAGERLHHVADALLSGADYSVLTDTKGRIVFGNGAFTAFLAHATVETGADGKQISQEQREAAGQHAWESALESQPLKSRTVTVPDAFSHHAGEEWLLQRTAVVDEGSGQVVAYLNVLSNPNRHKITTAQLRRISPLLSQLSLAVLLFTDGAVNERPEHLAKIEDLALELAEIVRPDHSESVATSPD